MAFSTNLTQSAITQRIARPGSYCFAPASPSLLYGSLPIDSTKCVNTVDLKVYRHRIHEKNAVDS